MTTDLNQIAQDLAHQFQENAAQLDENDEFASANYAALKERDVFSAMIPTKFGGGGVSHSDMCDFIRIVAHSCPSTALALSMHQHLIAAAIFNDAAGRPGAKLLEKVAGANIILVSTGANDWLESNGTATKVDGGFDITAVKPFASGSPDGQMILTSCAYDDPDEGPQVLHFPVPLGADGITFMDNWKTHGMRATGSQTLKFDNVFVPDAAIALRRPRGGFHPAFAIILGVALPLIMSAYTGVAEGAAKIARERAAGRQGDPVAPYLVGEMENLLTTVQITQADMVAMSNDLDFKPNVQQASQMLTRKTICAANAIATCEKAMEVAGGASFFRGLGLERRLRDIRASHFHPLPEKRQQLFTGRLAMGMDPVC
jgi:alkylation response protein AidB-like acyl-CoA dehydrogenase